MPATQALVDAVVEKLKSDAVIGALDCRCFPSATEGYRLNHPVGAALVFVPRRRYSPHVGGVQQRTVSVSVRLVLRDFSSGSVEYSKQDAVDDLLRGWCPGDGWDELWTADAVFVGENAGIWQFDVTFEVTCRAVTQYNACGA